jgi:hypothetical protein
MKLKSRNKFVLRNTANLVKKPESRVQLEEIKEESSDDDSIEKIIAENEKKERK